MFDPHDKVLKLFQDSDALLQGHFKLTSGKHSEWYFEKIRLIEKPAVMDKIIDLLVEKIRREVPDFDYVVSPAYGAIALGFQAALKLGRKFAFTQRVEEKMAFRSGFSGIDGSRAVIVEDILTTGETVQQLIRLVGSMGGQVVGIGAIWRRSRGTPFKYPVFTIVSQDVPTYTPSECPMCRQAIPVNREMSWAGPEGEDADD